MLSSCPPDPDETAESLYMGRLDSVHAQAFVAHMKVCARCRKIHEDNAAFVDAMKAAARLLLQKNAVKN